MNKNNERKTKNIIFVLKRSFVRFIEDRCDVEARSLSFITILLIVPFFIVVIISLHFFSFYNSLEILLVKSISDFFLPEKGQKIINYLKDINLHTGTLNIFNISLTVLVSFWLFFMITRNVNRIWESNKKVHIYVYLSKFIIFILVAPALLLVSFYFHSSVIVNNYFGFSSGYLRYSNIMLVIYSILINWILLFLLYYVIPNGKIKFKYTFISAFIMAVIIWLVRNGYNLYLKKIPQLNIVYGSLSFVPIFLIWIYISWLIVLYGLELNYTFHFCNK